MWRLLPKCGESKSESWLVSVCWKTKSSATNNTKKKMPTPRIFSSIERSRMNAFRSRGLSFITLSVGGSADSAKAAKVSIIRFTHSICVTVSGVSVPMKAPQSTSRHAATFTVSWKSRNRCMFW